MLVALCDQRKFVSFYMLVTVKSQGPHDVFLGTREATNIIRGLCSNALIHVCEITEKHLLVSAPGSRHRAPRPLEFPGRQEGLLF